MGETHLQSWAGRVPTYWVAATTAPSDDLSSELSWSRIASRAVVAAMAGWIGVFISIVAMGYSHANYTYAEAYSVGGFNSTITYPGLKWLDQASASVFTLSLAVILICLALFVVWFSKSVQLSARLGIGARLAPAWAVGGWFVPFGNLVLPAISGSDIFPANATARRAVKRWWLAFVLVVPLAIVSAIFAVNTAVLAALPLAVIGVAVVISAKKRSQDLIGEVTDLHVEMLAAAEPSVPSAA